MLSITMWMWILLFLALLGFYDWWKRRTYVEGIHRKAVFITGCDTGFGNVLAKSLHKRGVHVFAGCLTELGERKLREETGDRLKTIILDVTSTESVTKAADFVRDALPQDIEFWAVVNNAGVTGSPGPLEFLDKENFKQAMEVNLYGMIDVTKAFLPMLKKSQGRVVNMSSMAAEIAFPHVLPYCASKHAATGFSDSLRVEKSMWNISVSTIEPAFFLTNIVNIESYRENCMPKWKSVDAQLRDEYGQDYFDRYMKGSQKLLESITFPNINPVIDAFEHALFSIRPRAFYYPGIGTKIMKVLPSFVINKVSLYYTAIPKCLSKK